MSLMGDGTNFRRYFEYLGLSEEEAIAYQLLCQEHSMIPKDLALKMEISVERAETMLDNLKEKNYVDCIIPNYPLYTVAPFEADLHLMEFINELHGMRANVQKDLKKLMSKKSALGININLNSIFNDVFCTLIENSIEINIRAKDITFYSQKAIEAIKSNPSTHFKLLVALPYKSKRKSETIINKANKFDYPNVEIKFCSIKELSDMELRYMIIVGRNNKSSVLLAPKPIREAHKDFLFVESIDLIDFFRTNFIKEWNLFSIYKKDFKLERMDEEIKPLDMFKGCI